MNSFYLEIEEFRNHCKTGHAKVVAPKRLASKNFIILFFIQIYFPPDTELERICKSGVQNTPEVSQYFNTFI